MRVLIIEDDVILAAGITNMLEQHHFTCDTTAFGATGLVNAARQNYDIIILDLALPDISGFELLQHLRNAKINTPVLILSGRSDIESRITGLGYSADDFLPKPFAAPELVARIQAVIRRSGCNPETFVRSGDFVVNLNAGTAKVGERPVRLTKSESCLIELLCRRQGQIVSKQALLAAMSRPGQSAVDYPDIKLIDVMICKICKKLSSDQRGRYIETVWGRGYSLRVDPAQQPLVAE